MFKRTIPLPWDLDYNTAQADYENGVLNLKIAKSQDEKHKFKKISINKKNIETN
jgi:HSP20 family molecular chaperone IbpA